MGGGEGQTNVTEEKKKEWISSIALLFTCFHWKRTLCLCVRTARTRVGVGVGVGGTDNALSFPSVHPPLPSSRSLSLSLFQRLTLEKPQWCHRSAACNERWGAGPPVRFPQSPLSGSPPSARTEKEG